jgi:arginine-tRNA-protein transferase
MAYKTRYRPIEVLGPNGWSLLTDEDQTYEMPMPARVSEAA